jgi:hypothetical protein
MNSRSAAIVDMSERTSASLQRMAADSRAQGVDNAAGAGGVRGHPGGIVHPRDAAGDVAHQRVELVARLGGDATDQQAEHGPVLGGPGREAGAVGPAALLAGDAGLQGVVAVVAHGGEHGPLFAVSMAGQVVERLVELSDLPHPHARTPYVSRFGVQCGGIRPKVRGA